MYKPATETILPILMPYLKNNRAFHTMLFSGTRTDLLDQAMLFARSALCNAPRSNGESCGTCAACQDSRSVGQDIRLIMPEDSASITIDQVRVVRDFLQRSPLVSRRSAAVVYPADSMNTEAQNALLKILEEPPANAVIILATRSMRGILPTILSRSTAVYCGSRQSAVGDLNEAKREFWQGITNTPQSASPASVQYMGSVIDRIADREEAGAFLDAGLWVCNDSAKINARSGKLRQAAQGAQRTRALIRAKQDITERNANIKLRLTNALLFGDLRKS